MQVTIHIRKANIEAWNAIPRNERSALVNELLEDLPKEPKPVAKEPEKPIVQNWGNLDEFAKQRGLDKTTKHPSIKQQVEALGLGYEPSMKNQAFDPIAGEHVWYKEIDGEVILD